MKFRLTRFILLTATLAGWVFGVGACTTTETVPNPPPVALPPPYVQVPHPAGYDFADVRAMFYEKGAPALDTLKDCDADFIKLTLATQSRDELDEGARELVRMDPVKYHWCFYGKLILLENALNASGYVDEKQKKVLSTYAFLTPIARAYIHEFHDSRYMRWAIRHYRTVSEWMFYRKLDLSPRETSELVEASNPFGVLREPDLPKPVLEKYNIVSAAPPAPAEAPQAAASPAPAPSLFPQQAEAVPPPPAEAPPAPEPTASVEPGPAEAGLLPVPAPEKTSAGAPQPAQTIAPDAQAVPPPPPEQAQAPQPDPNTLIPPPDPSQSQALAPSSGGNPPERAPAQDAPPPPPPAPPAKADPPAQTQSSNDAAPPSESSSEAIIQGNDIVPVGN